MLTRVAWGHLLACTHMRRAGLSTCLVFCVTRVVHPYVQVSLPAHGMIGTHIEGLCHYRPCHWVYDNCCLCIPGFGLVGKMSVYTKAMICVCERLHKHTPPVSIPRQHLGHHLELRLLGRVPSKVLPNIPWELIEIGSLLSFYQCELWYFCDYY